VRTLHGRQDGPGESVRIPRLLPVGFSNGKKPSLRRLKKDFIMKAAEPSSLPRPPAPGEEPQLEPWLRWFRDYTREFLRGSDRDRRNVRIKIDHTLRVVEESRRIAASLDLRPVLEACAHLAALFHDIGRFPQYERYGTFNDRLSADHARLGVRVLRERGVLDSLPAASRRLILGAVFLHNRKRLPEGIRPSLDRVSRILRDADKLDILRVLVDHFTPGSPPNDAVTLELKRHPSAYTPYVLERVRSRQPADYARLAWVNDMKLMACGWAYDLNFPVSRRLLLERGYLEALFRTLPSTEEMEGLREQLMRDLTNGKGVGA